MSSQEPALEQEHQDYESPAIIYEGKITTRAGTPISSEPEDALDLDADELFGNP
ncbi:MAG: hypothetical protein R3272_07080 [Candidatus Promineifilaceae bacterium]|nr:hypothetical protein [Candidatus Promineifilaceae bacterium]